MRYIRALKMLCGRIKMNFEENYDRRPQRPIPVVKSELASFLYGESLKKRLSNLRTTRLWKFQV